MRKLFVASLVSSVAFAGAAIAQTAVPATGTEPAMGAQEAPAAQDMMADEAGFIVYQEGSQLLGSGLMGADVRGATGESIGSVDDILLDRDGQIQAVVVGIGGFLGIGSHDVAIANDQLQFVLAQDAQTMAPDAAGSAVAPAAPLGTPPRDGMSPAGTTADTAAAPVDTTAPSGAMAPAASGEMAQGGYGWTGAGIDHIMVSYTREQLEAAPEFERAE